MPQRGERRIAGLHLLVVNLLLDGWAVNVQGRARAADLGDLEQRRTGAKLLPDAQLAAVEPARGEVLAERAVEDRIAAGSFSSSIGLGGDQEHRLRRTAVDLRMRTGIARQTQRSDHARSRSAVWECRRGEMLIWMMVPA